PAAGSVCMVTLKVTDVPAAARPTNELIAPVPLAGRHDASALEGTQVQLAPVTPAGSGSSSRIPDAPQGPLFSTVIVKSISCPGVESALVELLDTEISAGGPKGPSGHLAPSEPTRRSPEARRKISICMISLLDISSFMNSPSFVLYAYTP